MDAGQLYQQRLARYVTAMRNEKPDRIPIRPFVAEFTAKYAGRTSQDVAHDYSQAFDAAVKTAVDFGWDAAVPNMVYVWTGLAQAMGLRYYGIPNTLLSYGTTDEVRDFCRRVNCEVAAGGGYIMDAGAIMQNDTSIENLRAMTEVCREEGVYASNSRPAATPPCELAASVESRDRVRGMAARPTPRVPPGVCFPWEEKAKELPEITGDREMVRRVWNEIEGPASTFIWQVLLSF